MIYQLSFIYCSRKKKKKYAFRYCILNLNFIEFFWIWDRKELITSLITPDFRQYFASLIITDFTLLAIHLNARMDTFARATRTSYALSLREVSCWYIYGPRAFKRDLTDARCATMTQIARIARQKFLLATMSTIFNSTSRFERSSPMWSL